MADFMDSEAEVSEGSDSEEEALSRRKRPAISSDEEEADKEKDGDEEMKNFIADSSAEEDDEAMDNDLDDLIDDNPVEDQEGDESGEDTEKRKHEDSELEEDLSDADYDLIEENLGIKVKRKQKRKRIRVMSDEESEGGSDKEDQPDDREAIQRELFDGEEDDEEVPAREEEEPARATQEFADLEASEESDPDDFIVDEDNQPISKGKKKKHIIHDDAALQEAQDIFGVDFDFDEFEQYGEDYDEEEELEEEYEEEEEELGEDGEPKPRRKKAAKKRTAKTTIYDYFEPSELERGHFTDLDNEIRTSDMPERFQLRGIPVCPLEEGELEEEADWIFKYAFSTPTISHQELADGGDGQGQFGRAGSANRRSPTTINRIAEALKFMRNSQFEVPFIAFYRKEYVEPELNIIDLWKVYHWDEKWMQLRNRRQNLVRLFEKMQQYQIDTVDLDKPLESNFRTLTEDDINRAKCVQTLEELRDTYQHFLLYYSSEIPKMKVHFKTKKKEKKITVEGEEGEGEENQEQEEEEEHGETLKQAPRKTGYTMCEQAGLGEFARRFGLTPEQFGENLRDNYQRHEVEQEPAEPKELAGEFIKGQFQTEDDVLKGARHMVAMQISHDPLVRQTVRQTYYERAKITIKPTKKGKKEIDESHPCYTVKYVKNKTVRDLENDLFLKVKIAEDDGLLTYTIHIDDYEYIEGTKVSSGLGMYVDEIRQLYHRDEFSTLVQEWNAQRSLALERALDQILYPQLVKEVQGKLLEEAKEHVLKAACQKLYNFLKVAPYQADQQLDDDDDDFDTSKGIRVMGVAYVPDRSQAAFCCIIDGDGEVMDHLRLPHILKKRTAWRLEDRESKQEDMSKLKEFILGKKPHVIAIAGESRDATAIADDIRSIVTELEQEEQMAPIGVELVDNEMSIVYSNCKKAEQDFREYPHLLRQAVSLARRLQDPLIEFCQLCNADEDILSLKFHPYQDQLNKEDLVNALFLEFVNRVNEVGVDVDRAVNHSYTSGLVQFVCGLGPRKGSHLLRILKQNNARLENRTQLVTMCHMGPKVFINCAGFIKIDTNSLGDSTEAYVEVLDGCRVHPETYEWARKMAVDALEYDDTAEDANPAGALEEILESPERLRDLDLDAFAEELERQGYGNKHITLYDIRAELNHRYKDLRTPYRSPSIEEKFNMLTKESPRTFYIGKLIQCTATGIAHRRPQGDQLDQANPVRDDDTGLWACPFCQKKDFPELSEVWNHFDAGECPGQAVGVRTRLDNGVSGFLPLKFLSDKKVTNPEERVRVGMQLHCRIMKIDIERFQAELTSRSSDLADKESKWKLTKDTYYDFDTEEKDMKSEEDKKKQQARQTYVKRVIAHPSFHNVDFKASEKLMENVEQGDVIIRPSSKGSDHLTVTWKVTDGIHQHIDVREEGKENAFSLGSSLWIESEEFEDLDEIIARHIQPMAAFARDILNYKYYQHAEGGKRELIDKTLIEEKKKAPSRIPYYLTTTRQYPGKFMLSYLPRKSTKHEYVTVTPDGFRYRQQVFHSLNSLVRWFKEHFRDPIPGTPATMRTPVANNVAATPSVNLANIDSATIRRAAAGLSSGMFNTLAQVAGQTPGSQFNQPGFNAGGFNAGFNYQPGVTPMMTPMMTPSYHTGGQNLTTPGQHMTPAHNIATTPAAHGLNTPAQQPTITTPQYTATPRTSNWPGATPTRTPSQHQVATAAAAVAARNRGHMMPGSQAAVDWAKAAAMWAQRSQDFKPKKGGTPRPGQSPMVGASPMHPGTPAGDATPLFDER